MKSFLSRLLLSISLFLRWLGQQPILEPVKELLQYQRTMVLIAGVLSFKVLPWLLVDTPLWLQTLVAIFVLSVLLGLFFGLQKEVLLETSQKQLAEGLPDTLQDYAREFSALLLKAIMAKTGNGNSPQVPVVSPGASDA